MLTAGCGDDQVQIRVLGGQRGFVLRLGWCGFEAFDFGGGNVDVSAGGISAHVESSGFANDLVMFVAETESVAQVGELGSMELKREHRNHPKRYVPTHSPLPSARVPARWLPPHRSRRYAA